MPIDLDIKTRDIIDSMFQSARTQLKHGEFQDAVKTAEKAWEQLPEPKFQWDVSKSYTHSIAKIYRETQNYQRGIDIMEQLFASNTVKPYQDDPFFIMGTLFFESGDHPKAFKWLTEANRISKGRCFKEENPKYFAFFISQKTESS